MGGDPFKGRQGEGCAEVEGSFDNYVSKHGVYVQRAVEGLLLKSVGLCIAFGHVYGK